MWGALFLQLHHLLWHHHFRSEQLSCVAVELGFGSTKSKLPLKILGAIKSGHVRSTDGRTCTSTPLAHEASWLDSVALPFRRRTAVRRRAFFKSVR